MNYLGNYKSNCQSFVKNTCNKFDFTHDWTLGDWAVNIIPTGGLVELITDASIELGYLITCNKTHKFAENFFNAPCKTIVKRIAQILWVPVIFCAAVKTAMACWSCCYPAKVVTQPHKKEEATKIPSINVDQSQPQQKLKVKKVKQIQIERQQTKLEQIHSQKEVKQPPSTEIKQIPPIKRNVPEVLFIAGAIAKWAYPKLIKIIPTSTTLRNLPLLKKPVSDNRLVVIASNPKQTVAVVPDNQTKLTPQNTKTFKKHLLKLANNFPLKLTIHQSFLLNNFCTTFEKLIDGIALPKNSRKILLITQNQNNLQVIKPNYEGTSSTKKQVIELVKIYHQFEQTLNQEDLEKVRKYLTAKLPGIEKIFVTNFKTIKPISFLKNEVILPLIKNHIEEKTLVIFQKNVVEQTKQIDRPIATQPKEFLHTKIALKSIEQENFPLTNDQKIQDLTDKAFNEYCIFLSNLTEDIGRATGGEVPHPNFNKYLSLANDIFKNSLEGAIQEALTLHNNLKSKFEDTPSLNRQTGNVTCKKATLKLVFAEVKKNPIFKRLSKIEFVYPRFEIDQKVLCSRLVQMVIMGPICKDIKLPQDVFCFLLTESLNKKSQIKSDPKMIEKDNSYTLTQFHITSKKTALEKFQQISEQYFKDICGRPSFNISFNGVKLEDQKLVNQTLRKLYTKELHKLAKTKPQEIKNIIQDIQDSSLFKEALTCYPPNEEELKTSFFPSSILEKILSAEKNNKHIQDTIKLAYFEHSDLVKEIAKFTGLEERDIEPLIRCKFTLEFLCFLSQSVTAPVIAYPFTDLKMSKNNLHAFVEPIRELKVTGERCQNLTFVLKIQIIEIDSSREYARTTIIQNVQNVSKNSKVTYSIVNDLSFTYKATSAHMDLLIGQVDPEHNKKILSKEIVKLQPIIKLNGAEKLTYINDTFYVTVMPSKINTFSGGYWNTFLAKYESIQKEVLWAIKDSVETIYTSVNILKNLIQDQNDIMPLMNEYTVMLDALQNKLNLIVSQTDPILLEINSLRLQINTLISQWKSEIDSKKSSNEKESETIQYKKFLNQLDIASLQKQLTPDAKNASELLKKAYEAYLKGLNKSKKESQNPTDFMWKTQRYEAVIEEMQAFILELINKEFNQDNSSKKSFSSLGKKISPTVEQNTKLTDMGESLVAMLDAIKQIKIDQNNPPKDHQTLDYQQRIQSLYQNFFTELSTAAEKAIKHMESSAHDKESDDNIDTKYANIILQTCLHFFSGINLKREDIDAVEKFVPFDTLTNMGLIKGTEHLFTEISKAKKPSLQNEFSRTDKQYIKHLSSWMTGKLVSKSCKLNFGHAPIDILSFGCPTSHSPGEKLASKNEVLDIFKLLMLTKAIKGEKHLYVSLHNITLNKSDDDALKIILGMDGNQFKALQHFEASEKSSALYLMNLSKDSLFYQKPEAFEGKDEKRFDRLGTTKHFKNKLINEVFEETSDKSGNYISDKIKKDYEESTKKNLKDWAKGAFDIINNKLFNNSVTLNVENRKLFIEYFYYVLELEIAIKLNVSSMNKSGRDGADSGVGENVKDLLIPAILNDQENDPKLIKEIFVQIFSPALTTWEREIMEEQKNTIVKVMAFALENKEGLKTLHETLWPKCSIQSIINTEKPKKVKSIGAYSDNQFANVSFSFVDSKEFIEVSTLSKEEKASVNNIEANKITKHMHTLLEGLNEGTLDISSDDLSKTQQDIANLLSREGIKLAGSPKNDLLKKEGGFKLNNLVEFCQFYNPNVSFKLIQGCISKGKQLFENILSNNVTPFGHEDKETEAMTQLTWYLMSLAIEKGEGYAQGTFVLVDQAEKIYNFLKSLKGIYSRSSSHYKGRSNSKHLGFDIFNGLLPNKFRTLLFEMVESLDGTKALYIKPENFSANPGAFYDFLMHGYEFLEAQYNKKVNPGHDDQPNMRKERVPDLCLKEFWKIINTLAEDSKFEVVIGHESKTLKKVDLMSYAGIWGIGFMNKIIENVKTDTSEFKKTVDGYDNIDHRTGREVILTFDKELK